MRFFITIAVIGALFGCVSQGETQSSKSESMPKKLVLKFAVDATYPPMEFVGDSREIEGFDVDLIHEISKRTGIQIDLVNEPWDGIFAKLSDGAYDGIISSVTITSERESILSFSNPYINAGQCIVTRANERQITSLKNLEGRRAGALTNSSGAALIESNAKIKLRTFDDTSLVFDALIANQVDAIIIDLPFAGQYLAIDRYLNKTRLASGPLNTENYGIAFRKGNYPYITEINTAIDKIKSDGTMAVLMAKWKLLQTAE